MHADNKFYDECGEVKEAYLVAGFSFDWEASSINFLSLISEGVGRGNDENFLGFMSAL